MYVYVIRAKKLPSKSKAVILQNPISQPNNDINKFNINRLMPGLQASPASSKSQRLELLKGKVQTP